MEGNPRAPISYGPYHEDARSFGVFGFYAFKFDLHAIEPEFVHPTICVLTASESFKLKKETTDTSWVGCKGVSALEQGAETKGQTSRVKPRKQSLRQLHTSTESSMNTDRASGGVPG